jgi:phosphatidate cytidylyltransferase
MITPPPPALFWIIGGLFATLVAGSVIRFIALRKADETLRRKRLASLRTWWILTAVVSGALLAGRPGICLLYAFASCVAWREFTAMLGDTKGIRLPVRAGYVLAIANYLLILLDLRLVFVAFIPLGGLLVLAVTRLLQGEPGGYIRSAGGLLWGMMFLVYGVSHAALLFVAPESAAGPVGPAGWFLFLIILTEANDIFQALIGRMFGAQKRHRISPAISPNKTWEGFLGGMLVTISLGLLLAPWLTTLGEAPGPLQLPDPLQPWVAPVLAGLLIAMAGFFGDINMSAIKRDAGVKDSSTLLPGMGGLIDRVDSLTMTAPVFVYFLAWWTG